MKEETTPTAGLQVDDIKRVTPLIRALYLHKKVFRFLDKFPDTDSYVLNSSTLYQNGYLLLRPLSAITDDEKEVIFNLEKVHVYGRGSAVIESDRVLLSDGDWCMLSLMSYDFLRQKGFALPFYDSITNTTLTVDMQVAAGIIKLKS